MNKIKNEFLKYGSNTPIFSLSGLQTYARVIDIHDGDTIKLVIKYKDEFFKFTVRINGIDTCEIDSNNIKLREKATEARNKIIKSICNKEFTTNKDLKKILENEVYLVQIMCHDFDKYGRLLCDIYVNLERNKISLKDILIQDKLAYEYDGGTKLSEEQQLKYFL